MKGGKKAEDGIEEKIKTKTGTQKQRKVSECIYLVLV
jgi:hypothetical protein